MKKHCASHSAFLRLWARRPTCLALGGVLLILVLRLSDLRDVIKGNLLRSALVKASVASEVPVPTREAWFRAAERDAIKLASGSECRGCRPWYHLGVVALALEKQEKAMAYLARATLEGGSQPGDLQLVYAHTRLGQLLAKHGRAEEAITQLESALGLMPKGTSYPPAGEVHVLLADLLAQTGRDDEAARNYEQAIRANPNKNAAYHRLMQHYTERNDPERVLYWHDRLAAASPSDPWGPFFLGQMYLRSGDLAAAIAQFEKSIRLNPSADGPHFWLGVCHEQTGDFGAAVHAFSDASRLNPGSAYLRQRLDEACHELAESGTGTDVLPEACTSSQAD